MVIFDPHRSRGFWCVPIILGRILHLLLFYSFFSSSSSCPSSSSSLFILLLFLGLGFCPSSLLCGLPFSIHRPVSKTPNAYEQQTGSNQKKKYGKSRLHVKIDRNRPLLITIESQSGTPQFNGAASKVAEKKNSVKLGTAGPILLPFARHFRRVFFLSLSLSLLPPSCLQVSWCVGRHFPFSDPRKGNESIDSRNKWKLNEGAPAAIPHTLTITRR